MSSKRLISLDVLRGFDMLWIIGGEQMIWALRDVTQWNSLQWLGQQMIHVEWEGFRFYDLIFPLFMFITGVAIPFSITAKKEQGISNQQLLKKIFTRTLVLVVLGIVYNGFFNLDFLNLRYASVLGQIGIAWCIAALANLYFEHVKSIAILSLCVLLLTAILQLFIPVPGFGAGDLSPEGNINAFIDKMLLPGKFNGVIFDSQGIICMLSASFLPLAGSIVGKAIRSDLYSGMKLTLIFLLGGAALILAGLVASPFYPFIKHLWTSTFNLLTAGISLLLLACFYFIIDVMKFRSGTVLFRVIGMNSILIYMAVRMIHFRSTSDFVFGGVASFTGEWSNVVLITGMLITEWIFLYILYKKRIFLKV